MFSRAAQVPYVPHGLKGPAYPRKMKKREKTPLGWGQRFRDLVKAKGFSLGQIAARIEVSESSVRHWTNGIRDINLSDFLRMCRAANLDPATVLFSVQADPGLHSIKEAWETTDEVGRGILEGAADAARRRARAKTGTAQ